MEVPRDCRGETLASQSYVSRTDLLKYGGLGSLVTDRFIHPQDLSGKLCSRRCRRENPERQQDYQSCQKSYQTDAAVFHGRELGYG